MPQAEGGSSNVDVQRFAATVAVCGTALARRDGCWYTHHSFGRVVEVLAGRVARLQYFGFERTGGPGGSLDYNVSLPNVTVRPWLGSPHALRILRAPWRQMRRYAELVHSADVAFVRGSLPLLWAVHWFARRARKPTVHWIVGNPLAIMRAEQRGYGRGLHTLGIGFAWFEQHMTRWALGANRAGAIVNGGELARLYPSPRTTTVVSTSITDADFRVQDDTCQGAGIRLLFVGFIRPEKGIEYLIRALPLIDSPRPLTLALVGSWDQFSQEKGRLEQLVGELGWQDRVHWEGNASFGPALFGQIDRADVLILPSLSEGTPRVLVEARARSVPVVSTAVGGIPTSVHDGEDGLLVPPRDPAALAAAVTRLIREPELRRRLIRRGRERVRDWTIERFVDLVVHCLRAGLAEKGRPQC